MVWLLLCKNKSTHRSFTDPFHLHMGYRGFIGLSIILWKRAGRMYILLIWKKILNVTKFASNMCIYSELGGFPILHNAWSLAIKTSCVYVQAHVTLYRIILTAWPLRRIICGYKVNNIYCLHMVLRIFGYAFKMRMQHFIHFLDWVYIFSVYPKMVYFFQYI